jgi:hypothetical protein
VLAHLDAYAVGEGQRDEYGAQGWAIIQLGLDPVRDGFDVRAGRLKVELKRTARAAVQLARDLNEAWAFALAGRRHMPHGAPWHQPERIQGDLRAPERSCQAQTHPPGALGAGSSPVSPTVLAPPRPDRAPSRQVSPLEKWRIIPWGSGNESPGPDVEVGNTGVATPVENGGAPSRMPPVISRTCVRLATSACLG